MCEYTGLNHCPNRIEEIRAPLENVPFPTAAYHSILEQQIYDTDESSVPDSVDKFVQQFALGI
jgi:hypothetical protein